MGKIGFDAGTYNLAVCRRDDAENLTYKKEVNAFLEMPVDDRFVLNMMNKSGVKLIERTDAGIAYALGEAAMKLAYSMSTVEIKRPMKDGCLNPKEKNAQQIMSIMIHDLLGDLKEDNEKLYYSVPANAINQETDADYHNKVLQAIFKAFRDSKGFKVDAHPINEALTIIYSELADKNYTGISASFGAGQVNLCYAIFGAPVFTFSVVNSGDWIDKMAAKATGESVALINKEKTKVDLTVDSDSLVQRAIKAQYEIMMQRTVAEIKKGLETAGSKGKTENPVDIVVAGGTSLPKGFDTQFANLIHQANLPVQVGNVFRAKDPLYAVAAGALVAAENS